MMLSFSINPIHYLTLTNLKKVLPFEPCPYLIF